MKFTLLTATALLSLPVVMADFNLWFGEGPLDEWRLFLGDPDRCDNFRNFGELPGKKDVSGRKYGVRCKGDGCGVHRDPAEIEELEVNLNKNYHFTIYQDRDFHMYDLDDKDIGYCTPGEMTNDNLLDCPLGSEYRKKFWCKSDTLDGPQLPE